MSNGRWWCFNAEKLDAALDEYFAGVSAHGVVIAPQVQEQSAEMVRAFLNSQAARDNKLIGGES